MITTSAPLWPLRLLKSSNHAHHAPQRLCFFDLSDFIRSAGGCTMPSCFISCHHLSPDVTRPPTDGRTGAARDRASQARGYKAEGRARHPKKSRGLLREVRDGAACKMRARPREARTARQQPKVIRRTPIRAAKLFVLQRQPRVSADQCHQRPDRHDARKRRCRRVLSRATTCRPMLHVPRPTAALDPWQSELCHINTTTFKDVRRSVHGQFETCPISVYLDDSAAIDGPQQTGVSRMHERTNGAATE
jgi:hypothetical protein